MERIENITQALTIAFLVYVLTVSCNEAASEDNIAESTLLSETDSGGNTEADSADKTTAPILLDGTDSGGSILVSVGQELQIILQTIGPGRYGVPETTSSTVQFIGEGDAGLQNPGGPRQVFRFYGVEPGEAEIRIPNENSIGEKEPFSLNITVYDVMSLDDTGVSFYVGPIIEIEPTHRICEIDSDCITAMTHCSCHCGMPVHKDYWQIYLDKKAEACSDYDGIMCKMSCEEEPVCIKKECVLVESE
ncbi:MAG: hypothetical protein JXA30_00170 [Deltaproteobacteria bacterium]|nr:hypothetical protein [Deltaproteobacteria bacterium]